MSRSFPKRRRILTADHLLSIDILRWFGQHRNAVLLETARPDRTNDRTYIFLHPRTILQARTLDEVNQCLDAVEKALKQKMYVAGYLAYEAGYAFEESLKMETRVAVPLAWFGVYDRPVCINTTSGLIESGRSLLKGIPSSIRRPAGTLSPALSPSPSVTEVEYRRAFQSIQTLIQEGDTYQVNYTFKVRFPMVRDVPAFYERLRNSQRVAYSAWLNIGDQTILSFSPELFFQRKGSRLILKPMKGTSPRGRTTEEDRALTEALMRSEKDLAENLMIVDLLRNDAGRVARAGSVAVPKLFEVEHYKTVLQATSTIKARLRKDVRTPELIRSLFPSGSVTGAPKIRTMQIIRDLESEPRGIYTGGIGMFSPDNEARFNVAIRTVVLDRKQKTGEMGIGSGITAGSTAELEYEECLLKAKFLTRPSREFRLFETMKWERNRGWSLLPYHLRRLKDSSQYFGFSYRRSVIVSELKALERTFSTVGKNHQSMRVKLLLDRSGKVEFQYAPLADLPAVLKTGLADQPTDSRDAAYFHKTTWRPLYDEAMKEAAKRGWFDVVFHNERGEITEGARSNIILRKGNRYITPALSCGVLKGTYRSFLMNRKTILLEEGIVHPEELFGADEVFLCNALRGMMKVEIQPMSQ